MNTTLTLKSALCAASLLGACLAAPLSHAATMAKADYNAGKTSIKATEKTERDACSARTGNAKDICVEEAKAKAKVARAELEFAHSGKPKDEAKVAEARAESTYAVAKERCDDRTGNEKDVCVKEAKAAQTKAKADAKAGKKIAEARKDATVDKRDADYKVASERCDAMTGAAKDACVAQAKARFGKT